MRYPCATSRICSVRGTVRSQEKADKWAKKHEGKFDKSKLEWAIVKDVAAPGAFDEAIKGVTILAHTASPLCVAFSSSLSTCQQG